MQDSNFKQKVLDIVRKIPKGSVLSYKQVAELAGSPKAYRVVGSILAGNSDLSVPCHRVIKSDGSLGKYNGLLGASKEEILKRECFL